MLLFLSLVTHTKKHRCHHSPETCLPWSQTCDGTYDCPDNSDETMDTTAGFRCKIEGSETNCLIPNVIFPQTNFVFQSQRICDDNSDTNFIHCLLVDFVISENQVCDGVVDCPDASDECLCPKTTDHSENIVQPLCDQIFYEDEKNIISQKLICNGKYDFENGVDERFCYKSTLNTTTKCEQFDFVTGLTYSHVCTAEPSVAIEKDKVFSASYSCLSNYGNEVIYSNHICNSYIDCVDARDETNCTNFSESEWFQCPEGTKYQFPLAGKFLKRSYIEIEKKCDFVADCIGDYDELGCSDETHFYCDQEIEGQLKYIPLNKILDGNFDCLDHKDECPEIEKDEYSSTSELIKSKVLKCLIWFTGLFAIFGNLTVFCFTAHKLHSLRSRKNSVPYCNRLLIAHLSLADFLQGISLISLAVSSSKMSGDYCAKDLIWRSSHTCSAIGFLTVLSSQTCLNILVILTAARLLVVARRRHFQRRVVSFRICWLLCTAAWLFAIVFAAFPLLNQRFSTSKVFIDRNVHVSRKLNSIYLTNLVDYSARLSSMLNYNGTTYLTQEFTSVDEVKELMSYVRSSTKVKNSYEVMLNGYIGYYSSKSVCLPDYYSHKAPNNSLSLLTISYNFFVLMFITCSYVIINKTSLPVRNDSLRQFRNTAVTIIKEKATLRRRTALLVATNAVCWTPVCFCSLLSIIFKVRIPEMMYPVTQIILIPVNSCINPLIYSMLLQRLYRKLRRDGKLVTFSTRYSKKNKQRYPDVTLVTGATNVNGTTGSSSDNGRPNDISIASSSASSRNSPAKDLDDGFSVTGKFLTVSKHAETQL